ncbi:hypothetical protein [Streptomyces sp. WG5]|uniref:hypothetical protein n=1 Tax=Streptomyces sp. WG5 TaxID=3417648 RepID=UPI003CF7B1E6
MEDKTLCGNKWKYAKDTCVLEKGHVGTHQTTEKREAWTFSWFDDEGTPTEEWVTIVGHPASGLRYQEWAGKARIIQEGQEIVSLSTDQDSVYKQYRSRVERAIGE